MTNKVIVLKISCTGFSSEIGTKLRDWAVGQAGGSCYSRAALSSNDSKTLYSVRNLREKREEGRVKKKCQLTHTAISI